MYSLDVLFNNNNVIANQLYTFVQIRSQDMVVDMKHDFNYYTFNHLHPQVGSVFGSSSSSLFIRLDDDIGAVVNCSCN